MCVQLARSRPASGPPYSRQAQRWGQASLCWNQNGDGQCKSRGLPARIVLLDSFSKMQILVEPDFLPGQRPAEGFDHFLRREIGQSEGGESKSWSLVCIFQTRVCKRLRRINYSKRCRLSVTTPDATEVLAARPDLFNRSHNGKSMVLKLQAPP